jgi:hypothetical protein
VKPILKKAVSSCDRDSIRKLWLDLSVVSESKSDERHVRIV